MNGETYELVVATFPNQKGAEEALERLKEAQKTEAFKLVEAATLHKDDDNKLIIHETGDTSGGKGAVIGGVVGGAIGLIGGPLAIVTGAIGAAIGGLAAKMSDAGFPDYQLREIGGHLRPSMSALVVLVILLQQSDLENELKNAGAFSIRRAPLSKEIIQATGTGHGGYGSIGAGKDDFFEMAAGATAVNLMNQIVHDENNPNPEAPAESDSATASEQ